MRTLLLPLACLSIALVCVPVVEAQCGRGGPPAGARAVQPAERDLSGTLVAIETRLTTSPPAVHLIVQTARDGKLDLLAGSVGEVDHVLGLLRVGDPLTARVVRPAGATDDPYQLVTVATGGRQVTLRNSDRRVRQRTGQADATSSAQVGCGGGGRGAGCGGQGRQAGRGGDNSKGQACGGAGRRGSGQGSRCGSGGSGGGGCGGKGKRSDVGQMLPPAAVPAVAEALRTALLDEYSSAAYYADVLTRFGDRRPFTQLAGAELRHAQAIVNQFNRIGVTAPPAEEAESPAVPATWEAAVALAVRSEEENVAMYDRLLPTITDEAMRATLEHLRTASAERHLPALRRAQASGSK